MPTPAAIPWDRWHRARHWDRRRRPRPWPPATWPRGRAASYVELEPDRLTAVAEVHAPAIGEVLDEAHAAPRCLVLVVRSDLRPHARAVADADAQHAFTGLHADAVRTDGVQEGVGDELAGEERRRLALGVEAEGAEGGDDEPAAEQGRGEIRREIGARRRRAGDRLWCAYDDDGEVVAWNVLEERARRRLDPLGEHRRGEAGAAREHRCEALLVEEVVAGMPLGDAVGVEHERVT